MNDGSNDAPKALAEFQRLLTGLPQGIGGGVELLLRELSPAGAEALRLAAVPHQFDQALLGVLDPGLAPDELPRLFDELGALSITIRAGADVAIHDEARAYLFSWWLAPERRTAFAAVSARLAAHFAGLEADSTGEARTVAGRARIFHLVGADQEAGFAAFEALCNEERLRYRLHACEALIRLMHEYDPALEPAKARRLDFHEAKLLLDLHRYDEAEALLFRLREAARQDPSLQARTLYRLGRLRQAQRRFDEASSFYAEALDHVRRHPELRDQELRLLQCLATLATERNGFDEAAALLREAIARAEAEENREELAACHNSLGILLRRQAEPDRAVVAFQASLEHLGAGAGEYRAAQVYSNLGLAYADQADWERARQSMETGLEIVRRAGDANGQATALSNLVRVYVCLQRRSDAIAAGDRAIRLFVETRNWYGAAATAEGFARLYRRERRLPEGRAALAQAAEFYRRAGDSGRAAACEEAAGQFGRKRRLPWYATVLLVLLGLLVLAMFVAVLTTL